MSAIRKGQEWVSASGLTLLLLAGSSQADILTADRVEVIKGSLSDQGLPVLNSLDQFGQQDNWSTYLEASPNSKKFIGHFYFPLPADVSADELLSANLLTNSIGEAYSVQRWQFKIRNFSSNKWVLLGDNSNASDWTWLQQQLTVNGDLSQFVNGDNEVKIRFQSNNAVDVGNLDYLVLDVDIDEGGTEPPPPPPSGEWWQPTPSEAWTWQWQINGTLDTSLDVGMYDVDLFDTSASQIAELKAAGKVVVCYFSAGTYEGWRPDWPQFFDFIAGEQYQGDEPPFAGNMADWDERWLDIRRIDLLAPIMQSRLDLAVSKGCDAVEPDNVDAYTPDNADEVALEVPLTGPDQIAYNRWLASEAHSRGLSIGLKNDVEQLSDLVNDFDWALNEQCFQYNECDQYQTFIDAGKAVFGVEYSGDASQFCVDANNMQMFWLKKRLSLKAWRIGCEDY